MDGCTAVGCTGLLENACTLIGDSDQPDAAMAVAVHLICDATGWPAGHVWLATPDGSELTSSGVWRVARSEERQGFDDFQRAGEGQHVRSGEGLVGQVFATGEARWAPDLDPGDPRLDALRAMGPMGCFAAPIRTPERVLGVLEFFATGPAAAEPAVVDAIVRLSAQLGGVLARHRTRMAAKSSLGNTDEILDCAADAFIAMDRDDHITEWNRAATALFGWSREEAMGRSVTETIVPPEYREDHRKGVQRLLSTGVPRVHGKPLELEGLHRDGHVFPIELTLWSIRHRDDWHFYAFARDIAKRKAAERELTQHAYYDTLTGLPNRASALRELTWLLTPKQTGQGGPAVLFVDVDHFKRINDSIGHEAGDQVLKAVAGRFRQAVRPADMVARLAGDEFLVVCPGVGTSQDASAVAERILTGLTDPVHIKGDSVFLTASIGVALAEPDVTADALIAAADMAMYRAKRAGRAGYELFDQKMRQAAACRLHTENELRGALEHGELRLFFQPIVDVADDRMAAMEALMRWQHPTRGLLLPGNFIPIAEETGLIVPMGAWAIKEACRCAAEWCRVRAGGPPLRLSVNLSARQLAQSDLVPTIGRILAQAAVDPGQVELGIEVTETMAMRDITASTKILQALHALGIRLSIDDFGTGYSSLAYLSHLPADTLKVDISFVRRIATDRVSRMIVHTIAELGRSLGMTIVAEGVETREQERILREAGVHLIQGFLHARPQPHEEILRMLASSQRPHVHVPPTTPN